MLKIIAIVFLFSVQSISAQDLPTDLEKVYKSEILFLHSSIKSLKKKIQMVEGNHSSRLQKALKSTESIEAQLIGFQRKNEKLEKVVDQLLMEDETSSETKQALMELAESKTKTGTPAERLQDLFASSVKSLNNSVVVEKLEESYYDKSLAKVKGEILKIGSIAQLASKGGELNLLVPTGEALLKIFKKQDAVIKSSSMTPEFIPVYINAKKGEDVVLGAEKGLKKTLKSGGGIGAIILALGILGLLLSAIRLFLIKGVGVEALENFKEDMLTAKSNKVNLEDFANSEILKYSNVMDRFGAFILVIAAVAPLLGLLGTVTGMISTFDIITEFGTGNPKMLSSGISEALVTTMFGLVVAIPMILIGHYLNSKASHIKDQLEIEALEVYSSVS